MTERPPAALLRSALQLEAATLVWMVVEAGVAVAAGVAARSLLLIAFGADSVIELISAGVLFHQLYQESRCKPGDGPALEALKQRTSRIAGCLLYALSAFVAAQAIFDLVRGRHAGISVWGIGVTLTAALGMPLLARAKIRAADAIGSRALRADAMETLTCGYLSWAILAGLVANAILHWSWLDSAASLLIVPLLLREAKEALSGQECCSCDTGSIGPAPG